VAHGHWFSLKRVLFDIRIYYAFEEQTLINVQSMIRLDNGPERVDRSSARLAVVLHQTQRVHPPQRRLPAVGEQPLALGLGTSGRLRV
jgi:hypothetical protein